MTKRAQTPEATEQLLHRILFGSKGDGTFCVKRAILSYSGHIRLPVDTTASEQKAEGEINPQNHRLQLKNSIFLNSLQCINRYYIIHCNIHIHKYFTENPASFSIGLKDKCRHLTSLLEFFLPSYAAKD